VLAHALRILTPVRHSPGGGVRRRARAREAGGRSSAGETGGLSRGSVLGPFWRVNTNPALTSSA
jgi:hypothetical protein